MYGMLPSKRRFAMGFAIVLEALFRIFQFASYVIATYTFLKYYVLPGWRLVKDFSYTREPVDSTVVHNRWLGARTPQLSGRATF